MNLKNQKQHKTLIVSYFKEVPQKEFLNEFFYPLCMQKEGVDLLIIHDNLSESQIKEIQEVASCPEISIMKKIYAEDGLDRKKQNVKATQEVNYFLENKSMEDFQDIFNHAFQIAIENEYEFFGIVEPEDILSPLWVSTVYKFSEENTNVGIFSPVSRNIVNGVFQGFTNEACWAEGMAEEAGKYDQNLLLKFNCISPLGTLYKVDKLVEQEDAIEKREDGLMYPFKKGIKLTSAYEFFLRMTYNSVEIMNIPRIGYEMRFVRSDKFHHTSAKLPVNLTVIPKESGGYSQKEAQFWVKQATDSYFIEKDEVITYSE